MNCTHCLNTAPLLGHLPLALKPAWIGIVRGWRALLANLSQLG
jgi:hypothetical protein